jgi:gamma-glutamylcyclotransferase (GGCT)/AIG2-like uncharacterized protein YtfP
MEILLFVYGTLLSGAANHRLMKGSECLGKARTKEFYLYFQYAKGTVPYVTNDKGVLNALERYKVQVQGEVYKVTSQRHLTMIDKLEGHPFVYQRQKILVEMQSGEERSAYLYFYNKPLWTSTINIAGDFFNPVLIDQNLLSNQDNYTSFFSKESYDVNHQTFSSIFFEEEEEEEEEEGNYFAYGSNMSQSQMFDRGMSWEMAISGKLPGWELLFNKRSDARQNNKSRLQAGNGIGWANIARKKKKNVSVEGVLYLGVKNLSRLDLYELGYERMEVFIETKDQGEILAITYVARSRAWTDSGLLPPGWYLNKLIEGRNYLSPEYLEKLQRMPRLVKPRIQHKQRRKTWEDWFQAWNY